MALGGWAKSDAKEHVVTCDLPTTVISKITAGILHRQQVAPSQHCIRDFEVLEEQGSRALPGIRFKLLNFIFMDPQRNQPFAQCQGSLAEERSGY